MAEIRANLTGCAQGGGESYPDGFGVGTGVDPLPVSARVSKWIPVTTAEALSLSLDLEQREIFVLPSFALPFQVYPTKLALRNTFSLVRILPATSVPWTGRVTPSTGLFSGNLTLTAPATASTVGGVLVQDADFGSQIGVGLIKIPTTTTGVFGTAGIEFYNRP